MSELSASRPSALPLAGASGPLPPAAQGTSPAKGGGRKVAEARGLAPATVSRHPFVAPYQGAVPEGETLAQFVARCVAGKHLSLAEARSAALEITVHGTAIPRVLWHRVRPRAGALVLVRIRQGNSGSGKKNPLRTILQLLVVIAVSAISGGALGTIAGISFAAGSTAAIVAAGVASIALNALVNAIAPIPQPQLGERSQSYTLSGSRNAADPYGPCVMTLGRMRVTPKLAMRPFTRAYNDDTVLYMLFQWHVGKCELSEIKIGDTPIGDFQDVTIEHRLAGEPYADEITLIPNLVIENPDISIELKNVDGWHVRAFPKNSTGLSLDLVLPGGLNQQKDGKTQNRTIVVDAEYRLVGAGSWTKVPTGASPHMSAAGRFTLTANKTSAIRRSLVWDGASGAGDYEVRVMRVSDDNRPVTVSDDIYWMGVRGDRPGAPVLDDSLCLTAVRIVASGQLNGVIDQLNAIVEPIMPVWSGGAWTTEAKTRNPAALFRWLHTGQAISAADRLSESELDGAALADWYDYCVTKGLTCDHVFDYPAGVEEAAQLTAACGYATAAWAMGKRTAVIDDVKLPTQLFTSETVRGFRGRIAYLDEVHALRCLFANAAAGYKPDEIIVYADGYDSTTATKFQQAEIPGKTSASDVWKAGRRLLKRAAIRRIGYEFEIDTECLVSRYGQRVLVEHFALHREAMSARIEALVLTSGEVTGVTLSETVTMEHGATYGLQVRRGADGTLPLFDVVNPATIGVPWSGATLTFTGAALEAFEPAVGDLVVWGRSAATVEDVSLVRLAPANDEFTATVFAVPYDEDLFSGDGASAPAHLSAINGQSAGGLVLNPVRPFTALEARLTAMLGDISAAAGDGVLTPAEKVGLVPQLKQLITTEAALVARAGALGITAEKTAFEAAMTTLNAYLATLTTDVAWDDQSGNTDVTGATLIADYRAALEKQIALQDAIDAANDNRLAAFAAAVAWQFQDSVEGWNQTGGSVSLAASNGILTVTALTSDPAFRSATGLTIDGAKHYIVRARARPLAASPTWDGTIYYETSGHGFSASYRKTLANPGLVQNEWRVFEWDMRALSAGGTDWITNTITRLRLDLANSQQGWEVDWIAVGSFEIDTVSLRGIKDNADRTQINTAAAITGQGPLATLTPPSYAGNAAAVAGGLGEGQSYIDSSDGNKLKTVKAPASIFLPIGNATLGSSTSINTSTWTTVRTVDVNGVPAGTFALDGFIADTSAARDGTWQITVQLQSGGTEYTVLEGEWLTFEEVGGSGIYVYGGAISVGYRALPITGNLRFRLKLKSSLGTYSVQAALFGDAVAA